MSVFDRFNQHVPTGTGEEHQGQFWCQEQGCFDVVESATYYPNQREYVWTCEEGHKNTMKESNIG